MLSIFVDVVLPVFIVAGIGFLFERFLHPPIAPLNQAALYVLLPSFVFTSLLTVDLTSRTPLTIALFAVLLAAVMLAVGAVVARLARLDRVTARALLLTAAFPNLGNYGLSVMLLAYGREGAALGTILLASQTLYGVTLAVFIASSGSASVRRSLTEVLRQPITYAVAAALLLDLARVPLPGSLSAALALPSQAAIPVMLLVLGMNVATTRGVERPALVSIAVFTRLVIGTAVGWVLALALGVEGVARDVLVVGAAMPTAVYTIVTATQFDARPRFVSDVVVAGTVASIATVTAVLALLASAGA